MIFSVPGCGAAMPVQEWPSATEESDLTMFYPLEMRTPPNNAITVYV